MASIQVLDRDRALARLETSETIERLQGEVLGEGDSERLILSRVDVVGCEQASFVLSVLADEQARLLAAAFELIEKLEEQLVEKSQAKK
jgi:hypothetical protein